MNFRRSIYFCNFSSALARSLCRLGALHRSMKLIKKLTGSKFLSTPKFLIRFQRRFFRFTSLALSRYFDSNYFFIVVLIFFFCFLDQLLDGINLTRCRAKCALRAQRVYGFRRTITIAFSALIRPPQALSISSKLSVFRLICIRSECKLISRSNILSLSD